MQHDVPAAETSKIDSPPEALRVAAGTALRIIAVRYAHLNHMGCYHPHDPQA